MCRRILASLSILALQFSAVWPPLVAVAQGQTQVPPLVARPAAASADANPARTDLAKGQDLLRRNQPDQALVWLTKTLPLLEQAGDGQGAAAAHAALGDLYTQYGQWRTALSEYRRAEELLRTANDTVNADLINVKLGGLYYLNGQTTEAGAAFARMSARQRVVGGEVKTSAPNEASASPALPIVAAAKDEQQILDLINGERRTRGLSPLLWDSQLAQMARQHSENMARAGFSGHVDQNGLGTQARAGAFGIRYDVLAENISANRDATDPIAFAIQYWLSHDIHRDNILSTELTHTGLGIVKAADGLVLITQVLITPASGKDRAVRPGAAQGAETYRTFISYASSEFGLARLAYTAGRLDEAKQGFENLLTATAGTTPTGKLAAARLFRVVALTSLGDIALQRADYVEALRLYAAARLDARPDLMWAAQRGTGRAYWLLAAREPDPTKVAELRVASLAAYQQAISTIQDFLFGSIRSDEARTTFLSPTQVVFDEASSAQAEMALAAGAQTSSAFHQPSPLLYRQAVFAQPASAPPIGPTTTAVPQAVAAFEGLALTYATTALQTVESGRACALLDVLSDARAELTDDIAPPLVQEKAELQARQQEIVALTRGLRLGLEATRPVAHLSGAPPTNPTGLKLGAELTLPAAAALDAEADKLEVRYGNVEKQIRLANPRYAALTKPQALSLRDVQQGILDDDTVLLEYNLGAENSYLWAATRNSLRVFKLPARASIEAKAREFRARLLPAALRRPLASDEGVAAQARGLGGEVARPAATAVQDYLTVAHDLYNVLLAPAAPYINQKRLLIVAAGALHFIPFAALVSDDTGDSYSTLAYLIKSHEIVYAPSASVLTAIRRQAHRPGGRGQVFIMADPVFDTADPRVQQTTARPTPSGKLRNGYRLRSALEDVTGAAVGELHLPRLRGTRMEAEQIVKAAAAAGSTAASMLDLTASETALGQQNLRQYGVLHFATHGILDPVRPQLTGLALSQVGDDDNDGFLQVAEIFNLRLRTPLVMLSACETGLGELQHGEGVSGLTRGFMYAGAPTVGVTLWSISDDATAELMPGFYRELMAQEGPPISASLRTAQLQLITGGRYSAPFYWAPFILVGDWR